VLKDGLLYGITQTNEFFCVNAKDGKTLWSAPGEPTTGGMRPAGGPGPAGGAGRAPGGQGQGGAEGRPAGGGGQPPAGRGRGGRGGRGGGRSDGYGSIVDAGPVLVALMPSSPLIFFEPSDKAFKQLAKYKVADTPTFAYPVIAGNRIFVKDRDSVILWTIE
jgi:outer membrane protein assembly factor BamB